jgi:glycerophosphoryl diester phosphodiesterase
MLDTRAAGHGFFTRRRREGRPLVIGHRGVRRPGVVENTLDAFEAAIVEGAEAVELDVRVCASGELVVLHDPTLARITGGADDRAAADLPLDEISRVALPGGARVPSLAEVLAFARGRGLPVNVELKHDAPSRVAAVRAAARLLGGWDPAHGIVVSSFDPAMVAGLALMAPRVPRALLVHRSRWEGLATAVSRPSTFDAVHLERTLTRPEVVRALLGRGLVVNVWTVNDAGEARDLAALGVHGLITDDPAAVRAALAG